MVPWLQVYASLTTHPKTYALAERLNLTSASTTGTIMASGMLIGVWLWALMGSTDGDLTRCSAAAIADAAGWKKRPEDFRRALIETGWLDDDGVTLKIHDWDEYVGILIDKEETRKNNTRERVKRYRDKKKNAVVTDDVTPCNANVTVTCNAGDTQGNAPTIPNITLHNQEIERANARAREAIEFYEQVSGNVVPPAMQQEIVMRVNGNCDMELIQEALRRSVKKGNPAAYFVKCLQNWRAEGIADYQAYCAKYKTGGDASPQPKKEEWNKLE